MQNQEKQSIFGICYLFSLFNTLYITGQPPGEFHSKRDDIAKKKRKKEIERVLQHYVRISQYHPAGLRTVTKSRRPNYIKYAQ